MKRTLRHARGQAGFTLIELIVVILILGILAATALPRFASLGGDARAASLQAAKGALAASAAMIHAKWLLQPGATKLSIEGTEVEIVNGYPAENKAFATAAGLSEDDYVIDESKPDLTIYPRSLEGNPQVVATCFITYGAPTAANRAPTLGQAAVPLVCE